MSRYLNLSLIARAAALILPLVGFTVAANAEEPATIVVYSGSPSGSYNGLVIKQVEGDDSFREIFSANEGEFNSVEYGPGDPGYRGPRYQLVIIDEDKNLIYTDQYFIIPLTGKPIQDDPPT